LSSHVQKVFVKYIKHQEWVSSVGFSAMDKH
jgi:hypothetical protein